MSSLAVATGAMAPVIVVAFVVLSGLIHDQTDESDPQAQEFLDIIDAAFTWAAVLLAAAYLAAAVGLWLDAPWGRGVTYAMWLFTLVLVPIGTFVAIWQAVVLPKRA